MHCKKCCKISVIKFRRHVSSQNLILQQIFYSLQAQICMSTSQLLVSTAKSVLITSPINIKVFNALDTIRRCLQCKGADMDTFFCLEKQLKESMQNNIKDMIIAQCFT